MNASREELMMRLIYLLLVLPASYFAVSVAFAQSAPATTVQLPSFSVFTVQTTVSVPDRGAAYLGGLKSGASSSSRSGVGPLSNRSFGSSRAAGGGQRQCDNP